MLRAPGGAEQKRGKSDLAEKLIKPRGKRTDQYSICAYKWRGDNRLIMYDELNDLRMMEPTTSQRQNEWSGEGERKKEREWRGRQSQRQRQHRNETIGNFM